MRAQRGESTKIDTEREKKSAKTINNNIYFKDLVSKFSLIRGDLLLLLLLLLLLSERSCEVVQCPTRSLTGGTALCPEARHINPCLVLVQPRRTRLDITENC